MNKDFGVNICGFINGEFGLGEGARSTIRSLEAARIPVAINNINTFVTHRQNDRSYSSFTEENPFPINIIQINCDVLPELERRIDRKFLSRKYLSNKYNIGYWAWELADFPANWETMIYDFNEIWTPSNYCVEAFSSISPVPVLRMPHAIQLPKQIKTRRELNLPVHKFIFLFVFDFASVFERKNPAAVIEAFNEAFGEDDKVMLVLKSTNGEICADELKKLKKFVGNSANIKIINGFWDKADVRSLIANCDCYVSLHRAEGFGLTMAEAMFYGKPTIATAYSANTDFMNVNNSFLVRYELKTLDEDFGHYKKGNVWAEPDIRHAARLMRRVFENPEKAREIGAKAAADVKMNLSPEKIGEKMKRRLEHIAFLSDDFREAAKTNLNLPQTTHLKIEARKYLERKQELEKQITEMEASRFWKIRNQWFKVKHFWRRKTL